MHDGVEVSESEAAAIAAAMRVVAKADGDVHPDEVALISTFASEIPSQVRAHEGPFESRAVLGVLLHTVVAVALADGQVSAAERDAILMVAGRHGATAEDVNNAVHEVTLSFFSAFRGVKVFREQAMEIARGLGLTEDEAARLLDDTNPFQDMITEETERP